MMMQKKMNNFFQELKKNLAEIPSRVEGTNTAEFLILLGVIFFLTAGSILCIVAIYFKFRIDITKINTSSIEPIRNTTR